MSQNEETSSNTQKLQVDPQNPKASVVGYNVTQIGKGSLQSWADLFYQMPVVDAQTGKMVIDPNTQQPKRMLDADKVGLLVKTGVYKYLQVIKFQEKQAQAQQQQQQGTAYG
jgi:hypothetical protein